MKNRKLFIQKLLQGAYITKVHGKRTLYEGNRIPVIRISDHLFRSVNKWHVLKDRGRDKQVISLRAVQRLHGKNKIKMLYRQSILHRLNHSNMSAEGHVNEKLLKRRKNSPFSSQPILF